MTFTVRLEQADGTPAEPSSIQSTVTDWRTGDTIPLGRDRSLRVVGIVISAEDEPRDPRLGVATPPSERVGYSRPFARMTMRRR